MSAQTPAPITGMGITASRVLPAARKGACATAAPTSSMRRVECSSSFDPFRALFTEVPRIWTLRRRVHKGKRKGRDTRYPAPWQQVYYYTTIAPAVDIKGAALASPTTSAQEALLGGSLSDSLGTSPASQSPPRHPRGWYA